MKSSADRRAGIREYAYALAAVGLSTAVCFVLFPFLELTNLVMVYLLGVLAVAVRGHRGPAALASTLSVLAFDVSFVPPRFKLTVADVQYVWTFLVMFATAMIISHLTIRLRREAESAREGQKRTATMHAFTQQLTSARGTEKVLQVAVNHVAEIMDGSTAAFVPDVAGRLLLKACSEGSRAPGEKEAGVAQWVYDRWQAAGLGTQSLPEEGSLYVPLQGAEKLAGVLRIEPQSRERLLTPERRMLVDSFAHQIGLALDVDRLEESARAAELEAETERLRSGLLSSVSHDFRTPLTVIMGAATALLQKSDAAIGPSSRDLLESIQNESERLSRLVHNLLEATRLESGKVEVRKELVPVEEVVGSAFERLEKNLNGREVTVDIPEDLPLVPMDPVLMEQVFMNLLENAARHTPIGGTIKLRAKAEAGAVLISIENQGRELDPADLNRVFEKFYKDPSSPGTGLGLAICRAVIAAHGGRIWAENATGKGAVFNFNLPLEATHGR